MNIDQSCKEALARVNSFIEKTAKKNKKNIFQSFYPVINPDIPCAEVQQAVTLTIYDEEQFYRCVNWCNARIGKGKQYWTVKTRVHRNICPTKKAYNPPSVNEWLFYVADLDLAPLLAFTKR